MQQPQGTADVPQGTGYADIGEVRTVTTVTACNQLLAEGWVLLEVYPLTRVGEMTEGQPSDGQRRKQIQDTQRYVRRLVGYMVGKKKAGLTQEAGDVFTEALAVARSIEDASSRAWALSGVAEALTQAGRTK
jgi:hypothetical protein